MGGCLAAVDMQLACMRSLHPQGNFIVLLLYAGNAINPARDFGPRLMHWVLPIAGKGSSEWGYAWVPVTANFVGGLVGGALYKKINEIYIVAPVH